jgi:hypothetical protein
MKRRGQFYLIAALVIILIIAGLAVVSNYARTTPNVTVYDLGKELGVEGPKVLEYGVFQNENITELMDDFTDLFVTYSEEGKSIYFVYGNDEGITIASYDIENSGSVELDNSRQILRERVKKTEDVDVRDKAKVTVEGEDYSFDLKPGENFYFIIKEERGDDVYVV